MCPKGLLCKLNTSKVQCLAHSKQSINDDYFLLRRMRMMMEHTQGNQALAQTRSKARKGENQGFAQYKFPSEAVASDFWSCATWTESLEQHIRASWPLTWGKGQQQQESPIPEGRNPRVWQPQRGTPGSVSSLRFTRKRGLKSRGCMGVRVSDPLNICCVNLG